MPKKYPTDQRDWALRKALERLSVYRWPLAVGRSSGSRAEARGRPETLRMWTVQAPVDDGDRAGPSSEELAEIKALESPVRDLTEANETLKTA